MAESGDPTAAVAARLRQAHEAARMALARALYKEGLDIMAASQPLVPVDTTLLRSTGRVDVLETETHELAVELSYGRDTGRGAASYAAVVHEWTKPHHPVGQHHYLSQPLYEATPGMTARYADAVRQALEALR